MILPVVADYWVYSPNLAQVDVTLELPGGAIGHISFGAGGVTDTWITVGGHHYGLYRYRDWEGLRCEGLPPGGPAREHAFDLS